MEVVSASGAISERELGEAERGFERMLRVKGFGVRFIDAHAADLLGQAQKEYAQMLAQGGSAENPVGWLIVCAWRRTQNHLDKERRRPTMTSIEEAFHLPDDVTPSPEAEAISNERVQRLQEAMAHLGEKDRRLLKLTYFEGYPIREAGRLLGWKKSSADRHHKEALERLRAILGSERDLLEVEVGVAAWIAVERFAGEEMVGLSLVEQAREMAALALDRATDLARRLSPFSDPSSAAAMSGGARAAGACGAAVVACVASGVVGPGVGSVDLLDGAPSRPKRERPARVIVAPTAAPSAPASVQPPTRSDGGGGEGAKRKPQATGSGARKASRKRTPEPRARPSAAREDPVQTGTEFGLEGGGSSGSSSGGSAPAPAAPRASSSPAPSAPSGGSGSGSGSAGKGSGSQTATEFGL